MKTWFDIQAKANEEADIFLYDEIGGWGVNAKSFIDAVRATGAKRINLRINSPGGSVFDGIAIYNFLRGRTSPSRLTDSPRRSPRSSPWPARRSASPATGSS